MKLIAAQKALLTAKRNLESAKTDDERAKLTVAIAEAEKVLLAFTSKPSAKNTKASSDVKKTVSVKVEETEEKADEGDDEEMDDDAKSDDEKCDAEKKEVEKEVEEESGEDESDDDIDEDEENEEASSEKGKDGDPDPDPDRFPGKKNARRAVYAFVAEMTGKTSSSEMIGCLQAAFDARANVEKLLAKQARRGASNKTERVNAMVDTAITGGKFIPAQRANLVALGLKDPERLASYIESSPRIAGMESRELVTSGQATAANVSEIEASIAKKMGVKVEDLAAQKASRATAH